jgi:ubiquinone/menaquinone biosynthesis C-methylase UbiE
MGEAGGTQPEAVWEEVAGWWQDNFTEGADPEYEEQILPLIREHAAGGRRVLEVGTGEGQVARMLAAARPGPWVVGLDPTANQIAAAVKRAGGPGYLRAGAEALPFAARSFDTVVACLVFEHIDALDAAVAEVARVLGPGGRFVLLLNHPLLQTPDSGWIDDQVLDPPEQYWRIGAYLTEAETVEQVEKGVFIRFLHRPLSRYVNALADRGLVLERMVEPAPPPGFVARSPEYEAAATVPRLLVLVARRDRAPDAAP